MIIKYEVSFRYVWLLLLLNLPMVLLRSERRWIPGFVFGSEKWSND